MRLFEKINAICNSVGYEYFGWNNPNRSITNHKQGYWAPVGQAHHPKINIIKNPGNYPSWDFVMRLANLSKTSIGEFPYERDNVIDTIYNNL